MGPVNWLAVIVAANLAAVLGLAWQKVRRARRPLAEGGPGVGYGALVAVMLIGAVMLGHNYARIGVETLQAKPWLYPMQSGGIALFFVIPAIWLASLRIEREWRARLGDSGYWLLAYLLMGATFWVAG